MSATVSTTTTVHWRVATILPILTLILGWVGSLMTESFRDGRSLKRRNEQWKTFQRQTLLDLQEAIFQLQRATGAIHHQDTMAYRNGVLWGRNQISDEWGQKATEAAMRVSMLVSRVSDEKARIEVDRLQMAFTGVCLAENKEDADACLNKSSFLGVQVHATLGELIRSTF